jgi:hypothetical protein
MSYKYETIQKTMEDKKCCLITTKDELESMNSKIPKIKYIASCGHENSVHINVFRNRGTGIICPKCVVYRTINNQKGALSRTIDGQSLKQSFEDQAIDYFIQQLNTFVFKRPVDGCLADLAIKPMYIDEDKWLSVQFKTTQKPNGTYSFHINSSYKNCIIVCLCWNDKKLWILDGNNITTTKLSIGIKKSKYDNFEVMNNNLCNILNNYYKCINLFSFNEIDIPISPYQKLEYEFRKYRESKFPELKYIYPNKQSLVYDFIINDYKIQEKIGTKCKNKNGVVFTLHKNNGRCDGKKNFISYTFGNNDYYWLHFPDKLLFFIIPEKALLDNGYLLNDTNKTAKKTLYVGLNNIQKNIFYKYLYNYNINEDLIKVLDLLNIKK